MARPRVLDKKIMSKIAKKIGKKNLTAINSMVSKKASRLGISAEASLIILAKEHGVGTSTYQRSLDSVKQTEVRDALPSMFEFVKNGGTKNSYVKQIPVSSKRASLKSAIEYLIQDGELRDRCQDILLASSKFDRPINQATLVLEDRIRNRAEPTTKLVGEQLVNFAFKEDAATTILLVPGGDSDDQRGFTQILRGIVPAFRNKTHHHVIKTFSREDAMRVCGFIDVLLRIVDGSTKIK